MFHKNLPLKGLVVVAVLVGAALAVPAGAMASMRMPMPMPKPTKETMSSRPRPPIPNGVYKGTTNRGAHVTIRVGSSAPAGVMGATFQVRCVPGKASFKGSELTPFSVRTRNFTATGMFSITTVSGRIHLAGRRGCAGTTYNAKLASPTGITKTVIRYPVETLKPMPMTMPMSSNMFNMMGGMQDFFIHAQKPCSACYIVGMVPNLVYPNGKIVNYNTGAMLHHTLLLNSVPDPICPIPGHRGIPFPQRIFASGNERTAMVLPAGYGYPVAATDNWRMLEELMNMSMQSQQVQVQFTYYTMPLSAHLQPVTPVWLDENECGDSEYSIPAGKSDTVWNYTVTPKTAGDIVAIGGHVHDYGTHISLTDTTSHTLICNSKAGYGQIGAYMKNIDYMSGCLGNPLAVIHTGDNLRLDSYYNSPISENNVMGIMVAYVATGQFKTPRAPHHR